MANETLKPETLVIKMDTDDEWGPSPDVIVLYTEPEADGDEWEQLLQERRRTISPEDLLTLDSDESWGN